MSHHRNSALSREVKEGPELVPVIPCVKGILYSGEEVQACPLCTERLMWYHLPQEMEVLACTNHRCVYPFDETSPYDIRSRNHNKICIEGTPAPRENPADLLLRSRSPATLKSNALPGTSAASAEMNLEPYKLNSNYDRAAVEQHLLEFMQTPEKLREPTVETFPFIDTEALKGVIAGLSAIEKEEALEAASSLD